jgi:hypothetical protein
LLAFGGLFGIGLVLFFAGVISDDRTLQGIGVLCAICGGVFSGTASPLARTTTYWLTQEEPVSESGPVVMNLSVKRAR